MSWSDALRGYRRYIEPKAGCESPRPAISLAMQPTAKRSRLSQPNREIAGKELEPQPSGNEREDNSDGRKLSHRGGPCRLVLPHALRPTRASPSEATRTRPASSKLV